jgi:calreticulin
MRTMLSLDFELWQVKAGTIFDNIIVTDDKAEADKFAELAKKTQEGEKKAREKDEAEKKLKDEEEAKRRAEEEKDEDGDAAEEEEEADSVKDEL